MLAQHIGVGKRESLTLDELRDLVRSREGEDAVRDLALSVVSDESRRRSLHELVADLAENARRDSEGGPRCWSRLLFLGR
jgi:hypothetical protein